MSLVLEKKANEFRSGLGLSAGDSIHLSGILARLNVLTVFRPLGNGFSGMAIKVEDGANVERFILVNSNHPIGKQHFTICHELYHLFQQEGFTSRWCITGTFDKKDKEEYNADNFAAFLLLPRQGIETLMPNGELQKNKVSIGSLLQMEQYFGCSRSALLYRLKALGLIDEAFRETLSQNVILGARQHGYKTELYEPGNHNRVVGNYGVYARALFDAEKISETRYHSLLLDLGIDATEIENIQDGQDQ